MSSGKSTAALHVKSVQNSMCDRRENDTCDKDNDQATVKCIQAGKELAAKGDRCIHRAHATEEHGRVQKCINPVQALKQVVANDTDAQRNDDEREGNARGVNQPDNEIERRN